MLFRKLLRSEAGYSMVEVIVSMFILAAAIIPMVGMFDMGLKSAAQGGNYDGARALANGKLDNVRSSSYSQVETNYPPTNATPCNSTKKVSGTQDIYTWSVQTTYVDDNLNDNPCGTVDTIQMKVVVTVQWQGKTYTITGLKTRTT